MMAHVLIVAAEKFPNTEQEVTELGVIIDHWVREYKPLSDDQMHTSSLISTRKTAVDWFGGLESRWAHHTRFVEIPNNNLMGTIRALQNAILATDEITVDEELVPVVSFMIRVSPYKLKAEHLVDVMQVAADDAIFILICDSNEEAIELQEDLIELYGDSEAPVHTMGL
jgi:hypothetical protein